MLILMLQNTKNKNKVRMAIIKIFKIIKMMGKKTKLQLNKKKRKLKILKFKKIQINLVNI